VAAGPPADPVLAAVRERLADDLDAPGALAAVDAWASSALGSGEPGPAQAGAGPEQAGTGPAQEPDPAAPRLIRDTVDALLGVAL
jgi:L-cysteine:1D-myo-inositol 2-amino-2-deoxy-alpha-D-glucopyranoside ligase